MKNVFIALAMVFMFVAVGCGSADTEAVETEETALGARRAEVDADCVRAVTADRKGSEDSEASEAEAYKACAHGYCCNQGTGNVSKTSSNGCSGTNEVWHANLAACLGDPVCGSPSSACRIN